ncbi:MAG: hypothetical protein ACOC8B_08275 [Gemmatimonadota bacterium]
MTATRGVPVTLDKERRLRFPIGVMRDLEDADLATILHAGLVHEDPDLTVEQVGQMIDLEMLPELAEPVKRATSGMVDIAHILGAATAEAGKATTAAADGEETETEAETEAETA